MSRHFSGRDRHRCAIKDMLSVCLHAHPSHKGGVATQLVAKAKNMSRPEGSPSIYGELMPYIRSTMTRARERQNESAIDVEAYADYVIPRITRQHPPAQIYAGTFAWAFHWLVPFLPSWIVDYVLLSQQGLNKLLHRYKAKIA